MPYLLNAHQHLAQRPRPRAHNRPKRHSHNRPRRFGHNPFASSRGKPLHGAALAAAVRSGKAKWRDAKPLVARKSRKRSRSVASAVKRLRSLRSLPAYGKRRKAKGGQKPRKARSVSKQARSKAARKAAKTRARHHAARVRAGKKAARTRARHGHSRSTSRHPRRSKSTLRRTKIRARVASVRGRRGGRKLVFLIPRSKKRYLKHRRWARQKIRYNPYHSSPTGLVATLKSIFSFDTVKVVSGGLLGFTVCAGLGEAISRAAFKDKDVSKGGQKVAYVSLGLGVGLATAAAGSFVISKWSPTLGKAFLWGGILGSVIRAIAAAFPGRGYDMPKTGDEATKLATRLYSNESKKTSAPSGTKDWAKSVGSDRDGLKGSQDWLPAGSEESNSPYRGAADVDGVVSGGFRSVPGMVAGTDDWLNLQHSHPLVGAGQSW